MRIKWVLLLLFLNFNSAQVFAANRIITVAQDGTGDFFDPIAAINSIYDASKIKPYVISVGPGTYFLSGASITMKPYVSLVGTSKELTVIQSFVIGADDGVVKLSDFSSVKNLTIRNYGSGDESINGIYSESNTLIEDVIVSVRGGGESASGIYFQNSLSKVVNVDVDVTNWTSRAVGINVFNTTVNLDTVNIVVKGEHEFSFGILHSDSGMIISNSSIWSNQIGMDSFLGNVTLKNVDVWGSVVGVVDSSGQSNAAQFGYNTIIKNSYIRGGVNSINFSGNENVRVTDTEIVGEIEDDPVGKQCLNAYTPELELIDC